MSNSQSYEALEVNYGRDSFRCAVSIKPAKKNRPVYGRRRGKSPQSVNGIHRRHKRKMSW